MGGLTVDIILMDPESPIGTIDDASFPSTFLDPESPIGTIESLPDFVVDPDISTLPVYQYDLTV